MAKQMNEQTEKLDRELLIEKNRVVKEIVKKVARHPKKVTKKKKLNKDDEPLCDYMKDVLKKRKRNKMKMQTLGLVPKSPRLSPRRKNEKSKKILCHKKPRAILVDKNKKQKCDYDHSDILGFKEEVDKRYFKKGCDLDETHCCNCGVLFAYEPREDAVCYVPSTTQPTYFCLGRTKFNCEHGYCQSCYILKSESNGGARLRRRK